MPAVVEEPIRGFALSDFTNIPNPPADDLPATTQQQPPDKTTATPAAGAAEEPLIKPLVDDEPEPTKKPDEPAKKPEEDEHSSLDSAMRQSPDDRKKADEEKAAADKKAAEEKVSAEAADKAKPQAAQERDADLKDEAATQAHLHPKTRKIITEIKAKTKAARDERDAIAKERDTLKAERDQLAEKAKGIALPKEVEEEVKTLRERVRELDITKDPIIEAKYDRPIAANNKLIVDTLKAQGFGKVQGDKDGVMVDNPKAVEDLLRAGLTYKTLNPLIKKLEEVELYDEAESIREAIRQNNRLAVEKTREVESWKADHGKRQQVREQQTKQQAEQQQADFTKHTDTHYRAELVALEKDLPYLRRPAAPLATDTPAVAKAKESALAEYDEASKKIEAEIRALTPDNPSPEKHAEIGGRINANAILAIALKTHVIPKVIKDLQARDARIKELETELNKIRDAGKLSRLQTGGSGDGGSGGGADQPATLEDALKMAAPRAHG